LSIGLPVYNGERYLAEAVTALLGQSYQDFELIISDNASTDATADICRGFAKEDSRVRYARQPSNIGAVPNHTFVFQESRGELFKWASADDLYARTLLERCVSALDEYPEVVLAHSWTAAIDDEGSITQAHEYPLQTDSRSAPTRFRSMLDGGGGNDYGLIRADDQYGVIRSAVLRKVAPQGSFYHSDRVIMTEVALHGPFHQTRDWLYFRRDHASRLSKAATVRKLSSGLDPRRADWLRNPTARLVAEYVWGYAAAIRHAPLSVADKRQCYRYLAQWLAIRGTRAANRAVRHAMPQPSDLASATPPPILLDAIVAGREQRIS